MLPEPLWLVSMQVLIVAGGIALMLRALRLFFWLAGLIGISILGQLLAPLVDPALLWPVLGLAAMVALLRVLRRSLDWLFGPEAAGTILGTWVVRLVDAMVRLPLAVFRKLWRWLGGNP